MTPTEVARIRAEALEEAIKIAMNADDGLGIYPAVIRGGEYAYEKRDDFKNGWNACAMEFADAVITAIRALIPATPEPREDVTRNCGTCRHWTAGVSGAFGGCKPDKVAYWQQTFNLTLVSDGEGCEAWSQRAISIAEGAE